MSWQEKVRVVVPYVAGEQPKIQNLIKLNTNENPYPPTPSIDTMLKSVDIDLLKLYPSSNGDELVKTIANYHGLNESQVFLGNGSDEVLGLAFLTFFNGKKPILFPDVSYSFYPVYCDLFQIPYQLVPTDEYFKIDMDCFNQPNDGIVITNPNAPSGLGENVKVIEKVIKNNPNSIVIVDEAYIDFGGQSCLEILNKYENLLIIQTCSKSRSLAGIRVGMAFGHESVISKLYDVKNSFNSYPLDHLSQAIAKLSFEDDKYFQDSIKKIIVTRNNTIKQLKKLGFQVIDSQANFIFVKHPSYQGESLYQLLRDNSILVRHWNKPKIDQYLRITIGTDQQMEKMIEVFKTKLK